MKGNACDYLCPITCVTSSLQYTVIQQGRFPQFHSSKCSTLVLVPYLGFGVALNDGPWARGPLPWVLLVVSTAFHLNQMGKSTLASKGQVRNWTGISGKVPYFGNVHVLSCPALEFFIIALQEVVSCHPHSPPPSLSRVSWLLPRLFEVLFLSIPTLYC